MKMLNEVELEMIAGGHIPIISPGEGNFSRLQPTVGSRFNRKNYGTFLGGSP